MIKAGSTFLIILLFTACQPPEKTVTTVTEELVDNEAFYPLEIKHAQKLKIEYHDQMAMVTISEPFKGASEAIKYFLIPKGSAIPDTLLGRRVIQTPVERFVCTSTTHLPGIDMLGVTDRLVGFPSLQLVSSKHVKQRAKEGKVVDLGRDYNLNTELAIELSPEVVMIFTLDGNYKHLSPLEKMGSNIVLNSDYLENTPLGRAEWIKFFGLLFRQEQVADSIFNGIETQYNEVITTVNAIEKDEPTSFCGINYKGVWYMPGGDSWMGKFLRDARSSYLWKEDTSTGSLELSFETVYDRAQDADIWINAHSFTSLQQLGDNDERYKAFNAYKNKMVYNSNARVTKAGGNDYYESGYSRPDIVLKDLAKIFHPELFPEYNLYYFQKLN
ncbi:ABC transporter substrate-binding protein [Fulvivirga sp. M361]|uniref:ABC transporter substrate-binding protein n=1 Tax=Fulvivirga sp. M361 TaxID=2594266 RepID=UPI0011798BAF|nr:ABC transporter substrate-binding protein [Fulvivirga sp. M361]TRX55534.1 ABC transporter substrate-binding protein [Fulvivirga sp. M361]